MGEITSVTKKKQKFVVAAALYCIYRKRLRDEQRNETSSYTNALRDALIQKRDRLSGNVGDRNLPLLVVVLKSMVVPTRRSLPTISATTLRKYTTVMIKHGLTS